MWVLSTCAICILSGSRKETEPCITQHSSWRTFFFCLQRNRWKFCKEIDVCFEKNCYALDLMKKWLEVYPVADWTAATVARCLAGVIYWHGWMVHLPSWFIIKLQNSLQMICKIQLGIKQLPGHLQCNGLVEHFNSSLKAMLAR